MKIKVKRPYSSSLRQDQARGTRRMIVAAAARLFVRNGYVATSIEEIAEEAGVSRATIFAVGGKADLLKLAHDFAVGGDDEPIRLVERPRSREIRAAPTARAYIEGYVALVTEILGRVAGIHEVVRAAAHADPDVAALWRNVDRERRRGADTIVADLRSRAPLRDDLDADEAADIVCLLADPIQYQVLVGERGWTPARFEEWLIGAFERELLKPGRRR
jgi:AcrR family transcriptional regulator